MSHRTRLGCTLVLLSSLAACSFDAGSVGTTASGTPAAVTSDTESTSGEEATSTTGADGGGTTMAPPSPTADEAGATSMDGASATSSGGPVGSESSGEPPSEQVLEWPATVAECVLLADGGWPYGGPATCEQSVSGAYGLAQGLMVVDASLYDNGGGGRPAVIYLSFDWPPALQGATVLGLELSLSVHEDDGRNSTTGDLWTAVPFTPSDLAAEPPPATLVMLSGSNGVAVPGSTVTWILDPADFPPTQPVYLSLEEPVSDQGIAYWNLDAPMLTQRPTLRAHYLP